LAANEGKVVIISALDGTFLRTGFDSILQLVPLAEKVKKLQAICKICNQNASFTFRTTSSNELQQIGGEESYKPLCRECFNEETLKKEFKESPVK
jgi:thymidine kinase